MQSRLEQAQGMVDCGELRREDFNIINKLERNRNHLEALCDGPEPFRTLALVTLQLMNREVEQIIHASARN
jgi:hypothetical protein